MHSLDIQRTDEQPVGDKLFEQFAQQLGLRDRPEGDETPGDAPGMSSFVDSIMNQLISKDVLYEPLKEIGGKYPDWLAANKPRLTLRDYEQYEAQYDYIQRILRQYDTDPEDFGALLDLLQQVCIGLMLGKVCVCVHIDDDHSVGNQECNIFRRCKPAVSHPKKLLKNWRPRVGRRVDFLLCLGKERLPECQLIAAFSDFV